MRKSILVAAALAASCGSLFCIDATQAQDRVMVTRTMEASSGGGSAVSRRSLEKWVQHLALDEEQKAAAMALHEGYMAEHQAAQKEVADIAMEARRDGDTADPGEVARRIMEARNRMNKRTRAAEKSFMDDLRSLLTADQEEAWPKVERMRRREVASRYSTVSGDTVDLRRALEELKLDPAVLAGVEQPLDEYELELDRAVQARLRLAEQGDGIDLGRGIDIEALQKRMAEGKEAGLKLREINQRHARRIESQLPESVQPQFSMAVKRQSFPRVYRESAPAKHINAALGFNDLAPTQRQDLAQLKEQYERELAAANDAWAKAIEKTDAAPGGGAMGGPGGSMVVRFGDEDPELADARKSRREVDERARQKLASILTPEQQERLPKPEPEPEMFVPAAGNIIIR